MDSSKIFIVGSNGQLGRALAKKYPSAKTADIDELDITNEESVKNYDWSDIEIILNAAAYTNVDGAETEEGSVVAWKVNSDAVKNLADVATQNNLTLVHISTDYVFDGTKELHDEKEEFNPLGVYGKSKAGGDTEAAKTQKHYILRTSWVIGDGNNFVRTMLSLGERGISPTVVGDQIGRLTFTSELVRGIDHLLTINAPFGTYNLSNSGDSVSWADITREIFKVAGYDLVVTDTTTKEYFEGKEGVAPRPLQSTLDLSKIQATGFESHDWREDLKEYISQEKNQ